MKSILPLPSIATVTRAIALATTAPQPDYATTEGGAAVNVGHGPIPLMAASDKALRRKLARHGVSRRLGCRRVPTAVVTEVAKKRTEATRQAAVQAYAKTGAVPKARPSSKRRPMPASAFPTPQQLAEAGVAGEAAFNEVFPTSNAAAE